VTTDAEFSVTFNDQLPLHHVNHAEWIRQHEVEMFLKKCANEIQEARKEGRQSNKRLATDLGKHVTKEATSNLPKLPHSTFMVVIRWVSNGKDMVQPPKQLQASYTNVRHWEQLIDYINKYGGPKEPYILTSMIICTLE